MLADPSPPSSSDRSYFEIKVESALYLQNIISEGIEKLIILLESSLELISSEIFTESH